MFKFNETPVKKKAHRRSSVASETRQPEVAEFSPAPFCNQLNRQVECLIKNEKKIENYHNDDKIVYCNSEYCSSQTSISP